MHVDDCADAVVFLFENYSGEGFVNVGTGDDVSIRELAGMVAAATGFKGQLRFDTSKPDGMPRKCLDVTKLNKLGYQYKIKLQDGMMQTIREYKKIKSQQ